VSVLWGVPYLFIRVAVESGISPAVVVWLRTGGAVLVLLPLALRRNALHGLARRWRSLLVLTAVQITLPFLLIAYGEQHITSSLAGLLVASEPLFVALLLLGFDRTERVGGLRLAGLVIGLGGVAALLGVDVGAVGAQLLGAVLVLLAALSYAIGALLIRHVSTDTDPVGVITSILAINTVVLAPIALPALPDRLPAAHVTASLVGLALLCTAAAFMAYFALIAEAGPSRATVVFYIAPAVTVAFGVALLGEPVTAGTLIGLLLIISGSWMATGKVSSTRASCHTETDRWPTSNEAAHAKIDGPGA
jgi:drug/metabolite transporter (DMT)-like permease